MHSKSRTEAPHSGFPETAPMSLPMDDGAGAEYAETQPMALAPAFEELSLAPITPTAYEVNALVQKGNRVCPHPSRWLEFYRILQEAAGGRRLPSPPLTGSAWAATPLAAKRQCFREQLEWAEAHGCITAVYEFLTSLPDSDWAHQH